MTPIPTGGPAAAVFLVLWLAATGRTSLAAQEERPPPDREGAAAAREAEEKARDSGRGAPVSPDSADVLRQALAHPPGEYGFDLYDGLSVPLKVVAFPLAVFGHATRLALALTLKPGPPMPVMAAIMDARRWGLVPTFGARLGPRSGVGGGLSLRRFDPFFLESALSLRGSQRQYAGVRLGDPASGWSAEGGVAFRREAEPHFWGIGPGTRVEDAADFRWDRVDVGGRGVLHRGRLGIGAEAVFEENWVFRGFDGDRPDLQDVADPDTLFGLETTARYARFGTEVVLDLTGRRWVQTRGFRATTGATGFVGLGTDSRFLRWTGTATGYLPLNERQQLVLRGLVQGHGPEGGRGVPFTHLAALGGDAGLRGLDESRLRDRDAALLLSEWRYEVWREKLGNARTEGFVFFDAGTVAPRLTEVALSDLRSSWGFGMRALTTQGSILMWYLGFSSEDTQLRVRLSWSY